jgi:hypothetical protein
MGVPLLRVSTIFQVGTEEEPKVEDHDEYEMEVPGDTSNDTCMFENQHRPGEFFIDIVYRTTTNFEH